MAREIYDYLLHFAGRKPEFREAGDLWSHNFICSGSPHPPPQGPLHYEAQSDVLPPLSFSYSESKIPLLPQKTTVKLLLLSLTPNFSLPGNN